MTQTMLNSPMAFAGHFWQKLQETFQEPFLRRQRICRTPSILQMESVECGAACLAMILGYYGYIASLSELRQACGVSRDGSKALNLLNAARRYHLNAKGFKGDIQTLQLLHPPYIIFWNFDHYLVVEGFHRDRVYLNDPAAGRRSVSLSEFSESFKEIILVFEPSSEFQPGGQKPSILRSLWRRLRRSLIPLLFCIIIGFLLVLPGLATPAFSRIFIDEVLLQSRQDWIRPLVLAMIGTALLSGLLTRFQLQVLRQLKVKLAIEMSGQFVQHLLYLPSSFYAQRSAGEIANRTQLNDRLAQLLSGQLATTTISAVMLLFYVAVMFTYDWVLTVISLMLMVLNVLALQIGAREKIDTNNRLMQEQGKVNGTAMAGLQNIEALKASGSESDFFTRWAGYYAKAVNIKQEMASLNQRMSIIPSLLNSLGTMVVLVVGGFRVMDGILSIGSLIAFQSLMQQFLQPVNQIIHLGSDFQELSGSLTRLDDVLKNEIDPVLQQQFASAKRQASGEQPAIKQAKLQGYLEIRNLTFGYNRTEAPLIEDFSLRLQPGQRVALVGGSGSGKSTIAKLVAGLYQPWSGEILFDAQRREEIRRSVLANSVAMVEQDVLLFSGPVRDNLTFWDSTIPESNIIRACQDAAIDEVINNLPGVYNATLLEGASNLSGGQRQRLEIARALINNPAILIMDEATSALDTGTEAIIEHNLHLRGCTCLIVAHRLSTIQKCDEIIVLERGKVVQRGSHQQLSQQPGHYLDLIRSEGGALEST